MFDVGALSVLFYSLQYLVCLHILQLLIFQCLLYTVWRRFAFNYVYVCVCVMHG